MIEKIKPDQIIGLDGLPTTIMPDSAKLMRKINELVDVVNALIEENNIHEKQIDELQMKAEPEKCETRPENVQVDEIEQAEKWIGKLCWFSQLYGCHQHIDILKRISESGLYVTDDGELHYAYCEPVKPDDDIIYKDDDNDNT